MKKIYYTLLCIMFTAHNIPAASCNLTVPMEEEIRPESRMVGSQQPIKAFLTSPMTYSYDDDTENNDTSVEIDWEKAEKRAKSLQIRALLLHNPSQNEHESTAERIVHLLSTIMADRKEAGTLYLATIFPHLPQQELSDFFPRITEFLSQLQQTKKQLATIEKNIATQKASREAYNNSIIAWLMGKLPTTTNPDDEIMKINTLQSIKQLTFQIYTILSILSQRMVRDKQLDRIKKYDVVIENKLDNPAKAMRIDLEKTKDTKKLQEQIEKIEENLKKLEVRENNLEKTMKQIEQKEKTSKQKKEEFTATLVLNFMKQYPKQPQQLTHPIPSTTQTTGITEKTIAPDEINALDKEYQQSQLSQLMSQWQQQSSNMNKALDNYQRLMLVSKINREQFNTLEPRCKKTLDDTYHGLNETKTKIVAIDPDKEPTLNKIIDGIQQRMRTFRTPTIAPDQISLSPQANVQSTTTQSYWQSGLQYLFGSGR